MDVELAEPEGSRSFKLKVLYYCSVMSAVGALICFLIGVFLRLVPL